MKEKTLKAPGKFNFFDVLLIVLAVVIVLVGAFLIVRRYSNSLEQHETVSMRYTILVRGLPEEMNIHMEKGEEVTNTVLVRKLGNIESYEIVPSEYDEFNKETQTLVHGTYEDLRDVYITIVMDEVEKTEREYTANGATISIGAFLYFRTPSFLGSGYVTEIQEIPQQSEQTVED